MRAETHARYILTYFMNRRSEQARRKTACFFCMKDEVLIELLADREHDSWARWMIYLFSICIANANGDMIIPAQYVQRWQRQCATPYESLSEQEKQSDRDEVLRIMHLIREYARTLP
jgi:hypothetical protein